MKEKTADIDILEELKEFFDKMDYEAIKHKPEEYKQAISTLIAENKELKEMVETFRKENVEAMIQKRQYELHYIPKSKVEQKINELEEMSISQEIYYEDILKILQSILGKE